MTKQNNYTKVGIYRKWLIYKLKQEESEVVSNANHFRQESFKPLFMRIFCDLEIVEAYGKKAFEISKNFIWLIFPYNIPTVKDQVKILIFNLKNEMSVQEIMTKLNLKGRRNFMQNYLLPALEIGYIAMTQPETPRSPTTKYTLTEKGIKIFKKEMEND
jgi:ATP-dependent DNA helicase RecG